MALFCVFAGAAWNLSGVIFYHGGNSGNPVPREFRLSGSDSDPFGKNVFPVDSGVNTGKQSGNYGGGAGDTLQEYGR